MRVPRPGRASIWRVPPTAATRSVRLVRPAPRSTAPGSNPAPLSSTQNLTHPSASLKRIVAEAPWPACFAAYWRASRQHRYTVVSTASVDAVCGGAQLVDGVVDLDAEALERCPLLGSIEPLARQRDLDAQRHEALLRAPARDPRPTPRRSPSPPPA